MLLVMDFLEHWLKPLLICRGNYSNYHTQQSSDLTWNIVARYSCLQPRLTFWKLDPIQNTCARIIYKVPYDTRAEPVLILLNLDHLGDWGQLSKTDEIICLRQLSPCSETLGPTTTLSVPKPKTVLRKRCPSVVGATIFNQWSASYSDSEGSWIPHLTQVQGAENGLVLENFINVHHQLYNVQIISVNERC